MPCKKSINMSNSFDIATPVVTALDVTNGKELNRQKAYNSPRSTTTTTQCEIHKDKNNDDEYSKAQQPSQITLQQIKNKKQQQNRREDTTKAAGVNKKIHQDDGDDDDDEVSEEALESNENEHLLGGQEQQQAMKNSATAAARVNLNETSSTATSDVRRAKYKRYREDEEADNPNKHPTNPLGSSQSFITSTKTIAEDIDLKTHCKLELHKFPKEMTQSQNNINEQNGSTIILTPTLLTPTTDGQHGFTNIGGTTASGGGDGGEGAAATNVAAFHDDVYKGPKIWQYLVRNYPVTSQPLAIFIIFIVLWLLGYVLMPEYAIPSTAIMRLILLIVGAQITGILVTFIKLPDMLGMLFFGVLYTNVGLADFSGYQRLEAFLREMALINIMLLAGFGLDANAFKKLWFMILRLTLIPTIAEVTIITVLAHFLLNMSWLWGILLGLVITAVSPNVVVTVMLKLKEERLGLNNGIHTLIYAMTTCNDVVAIFLFGVFCGVIFSTGTLTEQILQGPIGIGIGFVFGYVYGLMLQFLPSRNAIYVNGLRFVLTVLGGTIAVMGSKTIGYPSAGALGCVTVAFIASIGWKRQEKKLTPQQLQAYENANVGKRLDLMWKFLKPVSFALIGKEINFTVLDGKVVGYGVLLVILGSVFRLAFAYLSTYGGNLSIKERGYITISSFPKATVQAALGPIALDLARSLNADAATLSLASNVLIISVLAIIFTAPLGAILMLRLAPIWLQRSATNDDNMADDNRGGNVNMTVEYENSTAGNANNEEFSGNDNLDRHQKSV
ncbi:sodium/hydrogen exchanger 9B2 isoform X1 [Lucilia sericata]|uniref:sodium/hydrogen exchanger 9B2 isoform X1 n=1 Tax=Lucilia sericata TaxID=13632 RepID=UPI0018A86958|nr:sodium/hydrogen exchanger 9B2 isoform X1 [Lucilia sericata]